MHVANWTTRGISIGILALSGWCLADETRNVRSLSRVGLIVAGTGAFVATVYFEAFLVAVMGVMLPVALFIAWWDGLWGG